jgi:hypothetical protein
MRRSGRSRSRPAGEVALAEPGPYLWANGPTKRADGFSYTEADFSPGDGTHESAAGQEKVGQELLKLFGSDSTTEPWLGRAK